MQHTKLAAQYEEHPLTAIHQVDIAIIDGVHHAKITRFDGTVVATFIGTAYLGGPIHDEETINKWARREIMSDFERMERQMRPESTENHRVQWMIDELWARFGTIERKNGGDRWGDLHLVKWRTKDGRTPYVFFSDVDYAVNVTVKCGDVVFRPHRDSGMCSEGGNAPRIMQWVTEKLAQCEQDGTITRIEL